MGADGLYFLNYNWKIDPDGRDDRKPGEVITRKMTDEEKKKYGIANNAIGKAEVENMREPLDLDINRMLEICRELGTGIKGAKQIAKEFRLTDKQATNQIYNRGIKKMLQEEKEAEQAGTLGIDDPALDEAMKKVAHSISHEVDLMMEMVPDNINHPKHYNAGKYEVIDIIESIVDSMELTPFEGFCIGCAVKYVARWKNKGGAEDIKKAIWYLNKIAVNETA